MAQENLTGKRELTMQPEKLMIPAMGMVMTVAVVEALRHLSAPTPPGGTSPLTVAAAAENPTFTLNSAHRPILTVKNNTSIPFHLHIALWCWWNPPTGGSTDLGAIDKDLPANGTITTTSADFAPLQIPLNVAYFGSHSIFCWIIETELNQELFPAKEIAVVHVKGIEDSDWDPMLYDLNGDGIIDNEELNLSTDHCNAGYITEAQKDDVIAKWLESAEALGVTLTWT